MFKILITDEFDFNRKIRGETIQTYKKLIKAHRRMIKNTSIEHLSIKEQAEEIMRIKHLQSEDEKKFSNLKKFMNAEEQLLLIQKQKEEKTEYCYCRGPGSRHVDDFYIGKTDRADF